MPFNSAQRLVLLAPSPDLIGGAPVAPFVAQTQSLDFDGTTETLKSLEQASLGIGDVFTIAMWVRPRVQPIGSGRSMLRIASAGNAQSISIATRGSGAVPANDGIQFTLTDSANIVRQNVAWGTPLAGPENCWHLIVVQWGGFGSTRACYVDGVNLGAGSNFTNAAIVLSDGFDRSVSFSEFNATTGARWDGAGASIAMWPTILGAAEITEMYNLGDINFDLLTDSGNYVSASSTAHWWEIGKKVAPDLAADSVTTGSPFNLTDGATGISDADRILDVPASGVYQGAATSQSLILLAAAPVEELASTAQVTGIGNVWTIETWVFWTGVLPVGNESPFSLIPVSGNANDLAIGTNGVTGEISVISRSSAAANLFFARYPQSSWTVDAWNMLTVTRTGSGISQTFAYMNGVLLTPSNLDINNAGTMTDTARVIRSPVGGSFDWNGFMYATTMWNSALTLPEIKYRFCNQVGKSALGWLDPTVNKGPYLSAANALHWYPFALNPANIGEDAAGSIDLTAANISGLSAQVP